MAAGFAGVELWENHAALADEAELAALERGPAPLAIFNSYATLDAAGAPGRSAAAALVKRLGCTAVKFNFGKPGTNLGEQMQAAWAWAQAMPGVRMLCECHPGTLLETPAAAAAARDWPELEVIVHPLGPPEQLRAWLEELPGRVSHCHLQLAAPAGGRSRLRQDKQRVADALAMLAGAGFTGSLSVEFTQGVGQPPENLDALFAAACDDLAVLREILG